MGSCRCKMCGGHIHYDDNLSVATCEFCGTEQTVVRTDDLKKLSLFNRANALRMQNEFDKAQLTYDNILIDDPNNAEAHWGICLCRYGIEYITVNNKKVPTCHRTTVKSIFEDLDYKETIENADVVAKRVYEAEAKEFDRIQKNILKISQKEEPYDIFISYKENDDMGNRTKDSMMGEIIYATLTNKGYRVFYSKESLKNKEVAMYEPIIFAALRSAKVMIPIGSKTEYFNSTWEKNEWSRFLSFMQDDPNKYLIPCYFDMEAYDMPDEFLVFETIDLNDPNYMDNLASRIEKLLNKKVKESAKESPNQASNNQINNLIERVKYCLAEKDFNKALELIENILNINYRCAEAYFYRIFVTCKASSIDELIRLNVRLEEQKDYNTALSFASASYKEQLININNNIKNSIVENYNESIYQAFITRLNANNYVEAFVLANKILDYKDVRKRLEDAKESCYSLAEERFKEKYYEISAKYYKLIIDYKDSKEKYLLSKEYVIKENNRLEASRVCEILNQIIAKYNNNELKNSDKNDYKALCSKLKFLVKDDSTFYEQSKYFNSMLNTILLAKTVEDREAKKRLILKTIRYSICIIVPLMVVLFIVVAYNIRSTDKKKKRYNQAVECINSGDYNTAYDKLKGLKYKDSVILFDLLNARHELETNRNYEKAIDIVYNLGGTTNVSYDSAEGTTTKTNEVIKKANYINNDSEAIGREFVSWTIDSYSIDYSNYILDLTLKATYNKIEYNITYYGLPTEAGNESKNSSLPKTYVYEESGSYSIPDAVWDGYTFLGWMGKNDSMSKTNYSFPKNTTGDISLTAYWKANEYTIYLDFDGGPEVDYTPITVTFGEAFKLPALGEREGYTFKGYGNYVIKNDRKFNIPITDAEGNSLANYNMAKDVTLKALWEGKEYKVTIKASTGYITIPNSTPKITDDEMIMFGEQKVKTLKCGETITLEAYSACYWYVDGVKDKWGITYTFVVPEHDCTIDARSS